VVPSHSLEYLLTQRKEVGKRADFTALRLEWGFLLGAFLIGLLIAYFQYRRLAHAKEQRTKPSRRLPTISSRSRISKIERAQRFPPPFPNGWYKLADSHELEPGTVKHISALGREFVLFRSDDEEKKVYCLDAYCPHLGANIGIGGKVIGNCVACPFHGWEFRGKDGQCNHIPYSKSVPGNARTKSYITIEHANVVLIWFHADNEPPNYYPPPLPEIESGKMIYGGSNLSETEMHIQDFAENAADYAHFNQLHSRLSFSFTRDFFYVAHKVKWRPGGGQGKNGDNPNLDNNLNNEGTNTHLSSFANVAQLHFFNGTPIGPEVTAVVTFVGPGGLVYFRFFTDYGHIFLLKAFLPLEGLLQRVMDVWYYDPTVPPLFVKFVIGEALNAFVDDMIVWANKTYSFQPILVKDDGPMHKLRRWYKQFYSASSRNQNPVVISAEPELSESKKEEDANVPPTQQEEISW
jgi:cholesterol 7-dehydrogenase